MAAQEVGQQIVLPLSKAVELSAKSIRVRLGRSLITMSGIILAIAFLMSIGTSNAVLDRLRQVDDPKVQSVLQAKGLDLDSEAIREERARNTWLVVLSLLVCLVGIWNSMLMSVTERFREIGTMKCLGALDFFIIKIFLLESSFQGVVGTLVGMFLGLVLSLAMSLGTYGSAVMRYFPWGAVLRWGILSFLIGSVLSVVAAIYPAYVAAKMEPVEAMRVDR
ncbi:MAG TPA: FtsX-like permease family protein [Candidatus Latescibacteria bacterium]|nr:FtsX-like permease family protein [Candidatus Latescibacterota bacterium]